MEEKTKSNIWLKILSGGSRYILGLLLIASGPLTLLFYGKDIMIMTHAIVHPALTIFVTPPILIGLYFMFTGKWRPRIDFTLFLIATVLVYMFSTFAAAFNS
jgi:hypothetical protein